MSTSSGSSSSLGDESDLPTHSTLPAKAAASSSLSSGVKSGKAMGKAMGKAVIDDPSSSRGESLVPPPNYLEGENDTTLEAALSFVEELEDSDHFTKLREAESLFDALIRLDASLVSTYAGNRRFFKRKRVPPGHVGLGDASSRTMFFRPGAYTRIGFGRKLPRGAVAPIPGPGERLSHGDITYIHVRGDQVAVITIGAESHIVGKGRYLIRSPDHASECISIREPGTRETRTIVRESQQLNEEGDLIDHRETAEEAAGYRSTVGSIQFLRAEPGYAWAVQRGDGKVRTGDGITAVRRDERFIDFLSTQRTTRTTELKSYYTADAEEARVKLQLQWQLLDGNLWTRQCKAYDDAYDYLDEILDSLLHDNIGACSKDQLQDQRLEKYDEFEAQVRPPLEDAANAVGVRLISLEVRHLRFPVADNIERERRAHESAARSKQREHDYQTQLKRQELAQQAEAAEAELSREQNAARREAEIASIHDDRELAKVEASANRMRREMATAKERTNIEQETKERAAEADLRIARLQAEAEIVRAEAAAAAAGKMAQIFQHNPDFLRFKELELAAETERQRIAAIAKFAENPNALLPQHLQQQVLRMNSGYDPRDLLIGTNLAMAPGVTRTSTNPTANQ